MQSLLRARFDATGALETSEAFDCAEAFGYGNFQRGVLVFAVLTVWVMHAHTLAFPLISSDLDHWCKRPADLNISTETWKDLAIPVEGNGRRGRCTVYASPYDPNDTAVVRCEEWDYDIRVAHTTIVSNWDLVCHRRWLLAVAFAVYMAGSLGFLVAGGFVTDAIGRKLAILGATSLLMLAAFGGCFANTYLMYLSSRFVISGCSCTLCVIANVLVAEVSTNRHRSLHFSISCGTGLWLAEVFFVVLRDERLNWMVLQLLMVAPTLLLPLGCTLVLESPRWLIATQNLERADVVVHTAARQNGFPDDKASEFIEILRKEELERAKVTCMGTEEAKKHPSATVLRRALALFATSFNVMGAYYVVLLASAARKKPWVPWTSLVVDGVFYCMYFAAVDRVDRVSMAVRVFITGGAICCLLAGVLTGSSPEEVGSTLLILVKSVINVAITITTLCAAESFPSIVRGFGGCLYMACARLGGMFASAASVLRTAEEEAFLLIITAVLLFVSAFIVERLQRQATALKQGATPSSARSMSRAEVLEEMKATLEPRPKEKIWRQQRSGSPTVSPSSSSPGQTTPLSECSVYPPYHFTSSRNVRLG
ncbi:solute carrier family 22 member 6-like [Amblyomma americanum]